MAKVYVVGVRPKDELYRAVVRPARIAYPDVSFEWVDVDRIERPEPGAVYLVTGAEPYKKAQAARWFPRNRGVESMRWTPTKVGKAVAMAGYAPGLAVFNPGRLVEVGWGFTLAARYRATGTTAPTFGKYRYVSSLAPVIREIRACRREGKRVPVAFDTETIGLDPWRPATELVPAARIVSLQFTVRPGTAYAVYVLDMRKPALDRVIDQLRRIVTSPAVHLIGANLKYDSVWLRQHWGIEITNQRDDTLLMGVLLDENRSNSLKLHAKLYTALGGYDDELASKYPKGRMDLVPRDVLLRYAGADPDATLRVWRPMRKELRADPKLNTFYRNLLLPSARAFEAIEHRGVCVDQKRYGTLRQEVMTAIREAHAEALALLPAALRKKHAGSLSLTRPQILRDLFYTRKGFGLKPVAYTSTKLPSTKLEHLQEYETHAEAKEFLAAYVKFSKAKKTLSTYIDGFMRHLRSDGRFHPTYLLGHVEVEGGIEGGPVTGRSSTKDPAYQCAVGETMVLTSRGLMRLDSIVDAWERGEAFSVLTHTGAWRSVVGVYRNGVQPVFSVTSECGRVVVCTANHPILTQRGWVRTDELSPGDTCYVVRSSDEGVHQPDVSQLGGDEESLYEPDQPGLAPVRRPGDSGMPAVAQLCELSPGHGGEARGGLEHREVGRGRGLPARELRVGASAAASEEPSELALDNACRENPAAVGVGAEVRHLERSTGVSVIYRPEHGGGSEEEAPPSRLHFRECKVSSVTPRGYAETFDLTIEGSHSFVADGIVVHNTIPKHTAWAKPLRSVIVPPPGYVILKADVSQGELRVAACVANERAMIAAYREGIDLHLKTGCQVNDIPLKKALAMMVDEAKKSEIKRIRQGGKAGNFGLLYTMQPAGFQRYARRQYGVDLSMEQAVRFHHDFFALYPDLTRWHEETRQYVRRHGYVRSPLGRVRHLPLIWSRDRELSSQAERQAINSPIQATLSDLVQLLIVQLARRWPSLWVFGFCHDSVEMYVPEARVDLWVRRLHETMAELPLRDFGWRPQLPFPIDIELAAKNLGETTELKAPA